MRCPQSESDWALQRNDVKFSDLLASGTMFLFKEGSAEGVLSSPSSTAAKIILCYYK
jgi:hypothetical protein